MPKQPTFWDIAHEQLNDQEELMHRLIEPRGQRRVRSPPNGLLKVSMRFSVVQLNSSNAAEVVKVSRELRVTGAVGELGLGDELICLLVEVVMKVVSE